MISGAFSDVEGLKPVRFSHGQFRLVVQATVRAAVKRLWTCGQRKRVAHMPTATTTGAEAYQCWISKQAMTGRTHTRKTRQTTHRFRRGGGRGGDARGAIRTHTHSVLTEDNSQGRTGISPALDRWAFCPKRPQEAPGLPGLVRSCRPERHLQLLGIFLQDHLMR